MITAVLAFAYISFICYFYGLLSFRLLTKLTRSEISISQQFIITCFCGLATVAILFTFLSLLMPLGNITTHLLLLLPIVYWCYKNRKRSRSFSFRAVKEKLKHYPVSIFILVSSSVLLVLVMHAWFITHPDTLTYHAQNIQWIQEYRTIPGIVNLNTNYGIQSSWFILCAIFSFSFTDVTALTFINVTVLIWFIVFVGQKLSAYLKKEKPTLPGFLWLLLLMISFGSYTQIRLTATSASPDFVVVLYSWLVVYLFINLKLERSAAFYVLLVFLSFFAITIKLSALPLLLFALYSYYKFDRTKGVFRFVLPLLVGVASVSPFLARNVISTGYLLFPSAFPDFFFVDWKAPKEILVHTQQYITAYARTNSSYSDEEIKAVIAMSPGDWLPRWWNLRSLVDKIILTVFILLIAVIGFKPKSLAKQHPYILTALLFLIVGISFWFIQAPDPRFGFGFLLPAMGLFAKIFVENTAMKRSIDKRWLTGSVLTFSVILSSYTIYRLTNYFTIKNLVSPSGIVLTHYQTIICNHIAINIPISQSNCGNIPVPCTADSCTYFMPRGNVIQNGFKVK